MNELQRTINSREIAKQVGKEHSKLMRDIRQYIGYMDESKDGLVENFNEGKVPPVDFFIESTYKDSKGETRPCYECTKQGCEMIGNKMIGKKGVQFTAYYVQQFNQMEQHIKEEMDYSQLSPELQMTMKLGQALAKQEMATKRIENKVDNISEIVALNSTDWRKDARALINKIAQLKGGFGAYQEVQTEIYEELERRASCRLAIRLTNMRGNAALNGASKSKIDKMNKLDVIAEDKKLLEIYLAVVKEFAIQYGVSDSYGTSCQK
jgi:Rha family phage regulatory protein